MQRVRDKGGAGLDGAIGAAVKSRRPRSVPALAHWLYLRGLPEVARFPTDRDLGDAFDSFHNQSKYGGVLWGAWVLVPVFSMSILGPWFARLLSIGEYAGRFLIAGLAAVCMAVIFRQFYRRNIVGHLRRELVKLGVPICTCCGYDLTGNVSGACPESGVDVNASRDE